MKLVLKSKLTESNKPKILKLIIKESVDTPTNSAIVEMKPSDYLKLTLYPNVFSKIENFANQKNLNSVISAKTIKERSNLIFNILGLEDPADATDDDIDAKDVISRAINLISPPEGYPWSKLDVSLLKSQYMPALVINKQGKVLSHEGRGRLLAVLLSSGDTKMSVSIERNDLKVTTKKDVPDVLNGQFGNTSVKTLHSGTEASTASDNQQDVSKTFNSTDEFIEFIRKEIRKTSGSTAGVLAAINSSNEILVDGVEASIYNVPEVKVLEPEGIEYLGMANYALYKKNEIEEIKSKHSGLNNVAAAKEAASVKIPQGKVTFSPK